MALAATRTPTPVTVRQAPSAVASRASAGHGFVTVAGHKSAYPVSSTEAAEGVAPLPPFDLPKMRSAECCGR